MPMRIKKIRDYLPTYTYRSPFQNGIVVGTPTTAMMRTIVPVIDIRAIGFDDLQIHAMASTTGASLIVRGQTLLSVSASTTQITFWDFDSFMNPINISNMSFNTIIASDRTSVESILNNIKNGGYPNKYFAIHMVGNQVMTANMSSILKSIGDFTVVDKSGTMGYVSSGYNGKINDSMMDGVNSFGGVSQIYLNGINVALNKSTKQGTIGSTPSFSIIEITDSNVLTSYSSTPVNSMIEVDLGGTFNVDYIYLNHFSGFYPYVIQNHKITVIDESNNEIVVKPASNSEVENKFGSKYYLFGPIPADYHISGGFESSISFAGQAAAVKRNKLNQSVYAGFYDNKYMAAFNNSLLSKFNIFTDGVPHQSIVDNYEMIERIDIIEPIVKSEQIKYNKSSCSDCSYTCFSDCNVACTQKCGLNCGSNCSTICRTGCGTTCDSSCDYTCGSACANACGSSCVGYCGAACSTSTCANSCATRCTDTCDRGCRGGLRAGTCPACWNGCGNDCNGYCGENCTGNCYNACTGGCGANCTSACYVACQTACGATCAGKCYVSCSVGCGANCSFGCITNCSSACGMSCQIICSTACQDSCVNTCSGYCVNSSGVTFTI